MSELMRLVNESVIIASNLKRAVIDKNYRAVLVLTSSLNSNTYLIKIEMAEMVNKTLDKYMDGKLDNLS